MALIEIDGYLFSDDYERFYEILSSMMPVYYMSSRTFGRLRRGDARTFGLEKWGLKERFCRERMLYLDPAMIVDPGIYETVVKAPSIYDCRLPDLTDVSFVNTINRFDGAVLESRKMASEIERCLASSRMKRMIQEESEKYVVDM